MTDIKFITIEGHQTLSSEMAFVLSELDRQFFPTPWSMQAWNELHQQDRLLVILMMNQTAVGFCLFDKSAADSFAHLLKILVVPEFRYKGLAKMLLVDAMDRLQTLGCSQFFLEVEEDNLTAQKLYLSVGFKTVHRKKDFYGTGRSALIMTKGHS